MIKAKQISLEKIGVFSLSRPVGEDGVIDAQFIDFQFNKRAETSEALIDYIAKETGKNKTLVSSDLASFFEGARQYINIGKAFSIAGLGMLSLNRSGEYIFSPMQGSVPAVDVVPNNVAKAKTEKQDKSQAGRNAVMFFALLIVILIVSGLGWGIYKYIDRQKAELTLTDLPGVVEDSTAGRQTKNSDTAASVASEHAQVGDSLYYRFIFETTINKTRAHNRYDSLKSWGEHVFIDSTKLDSNIVYHLFVKANLLAKDTGYVKDSVQKYFSRAVKIVAN